MSIDSELSYEHQHFIAEYVNNIPHNATKAYQRVYGGSIEIAQSSGSKLLADERIAAEVRRWLDELEGKGMASAAEVLAEINRIAMADPRQLTDNWVGCCRHCYGEDHKYQYTPEELRKAIARYHFDLRKAKLPADPAALNFDYEGGIGFNKRKPPLEACTECNGDGETHQRFKDTRKLSPAAARIFAGVKRTKDGIEIKFRNQDKALEMLASHHRLIKQQESNDRSEMVIKVINSPDGDDAPASEPETDTGDVE